jgi:PAS domain S-box-containing protein
MIENMKNSKKSTILLVDDQPANILALEQLLEKKDRTFLKAASGDEALAFALNKEIDLIILDVQMPSMNGFEVSQILQSNKRTKDIPIIFASAEKKEHKFILQGFEEGAVDYLYKPLDPEITKAKVSVLLKLQLQKKELVEKNISLERSALLINNSADIICIVDAATLKFEEVNQAFTTILGYKLEEAKGTSLEFFLTQKDIDYIKNLKIKDKERLSFEIRFYCKDRTIKWLHWNVVIKDGKWFINARDITLVKQVERIRDYLATVVKQSMDAIYIHDDSCKIISWNEGAELMYGYTEAEALKMKIWNIIPEYLHSETQQIIDLVTNGQVLHSIETKRISRHGKLLDVLFSASVIIDSENGNKSVAITEHDITLQKIADEQIMQLNADLKMNVSKLEGVNKELEAFSYSVSHDLRSPLRALNSYAKMLEEDYSDKLDDDAKRMLASIDSNARKMGNLIDDLLEFSKMGRNEVKKINVNMVDVVNNVIQDVKNSSSCKTEFTIKELPSAYADNALINQVWINLISNAIKYSGKKSLPLVEIGSQRANGEIIFYVKDNGAGFDMAFANKLFGVFQRLHSSTDFEGTGIGLAIIHRVITRHGGRVWAESKVGEGATFYFTLPEVQEEVSV